jgi:hypothetical protein
MRFRIWDNGDMASGKRTPGNQGTSPRPKRLGERKQGGRLPDQTQESPYAFVWRIFRGPALSLTGLGLMRVDFWFGVSVVCLGLLACGFEICFEPWLLKRREWIQLVCLAALFIVAGSFFIGVVWRDNPVYIGYRITDTQLIELYIKNGSDVDYQDMDLTINIDAQDSYFDKIRNLSEFPSLTVVDQGWKLTHMQAALVYSDGAQYHITRPTIRVRCPLLPHQSSVDTLISVVRGSASGVVPATDWHALDVKGKFTGRFFKRVNLSKTAVREN